MQLYQLVMIDSKLSYDDYIEAFLIGFFSSREKAEATAQRYLSEVSGFTDYSCTYKISEKSVLDTDTLPEQIYFIQGWNVNQNLDEINLVESECFASEISAEQNRKELISKYSRQEWSISHYTVDECQWKEGFVRA